MRSVFAVLLAAVCFGTTGTAQALGPGADPASVGFARILIGGGALGLLALALHVAGRRHDATGTSVALAPGDVVAAARGRFRSPTWLLVLVGAAGVLAYQPAFFAGTAANGVAVGTVLALGSAPVLTGALDWTLHRRFPGTRWIVATVVATAGVAILALSSDGGGGAPLEPFGLAASVGAGASYAVYTLAGKALIDRRWSSTNSMGAMFGVAGAVSVPLLLTTDTGWLATPSGLAMALWLGVVTTTLAYVLFGIGLRTLAPATVSTLTLAEPLTAGILGVALLGETLPPGAVAGLVVLGTGIAVLAAGGVRMPRRASGASTADVGGAA
jgi:drug/metabolite transporter, DME family